MHYTRSSTLQLKATERRPKVKFKGSSRCSEIRRSEISFFTKYTFEFYGVGEGSEIGPVVKVLYFVKTALTTGLVPVKYGLNSLHRH